MKKIYILTILIFFAFNNLFAQVPQAINYQGLARDNNGTVIANHLVALQLSILEGSINGSAVYVETHTKTTDGFGLFNLQIGQGTLVSGSFSTINWGSNSYYLKVEIDPTGSTNYQLAGVSQFATVPYALYAKAADTIMGSINENDPKFLVSPSFNITNYNINNWDTAYSWGNHAGLYRPIGWEPSWDDISSKPTIPTETSQLTNNSGFITSEAQILSMSNDTIFLTGGSFVKLPSTPNVLMPPTATIEEATNIQQYSANLNGIVNGKGFLTNVVFEWGLTSDYGNTVTPSQSPVTGNSNNSLTATITGLQTGVTYHFRIKASSAINVIYSSDLTFTTSPSAPVLATTAISLITSTTATSGGDITTDNGATITASGVCWSTSHNPTIANSITTDNTSIGTYSSSITGLMPGTLYYVRAYATNNVGTAYGNEVSFTTLAILPTLTTTEASSITSTTATSGGVISNDGGANITARGICWSASHNPTIANSITTDSTGNVTYSNAITGLIPGALYYVRAYATNSVGTSYGNEISFTTLAILPALNTTEASSIASTTATSGGVITDDGGATITARGVCWSTSHNPTILNSITTDSAGIGTYSSSITGLNPGRLYYVRAFATNSVGTAYGNEVSFTTLAVIPSLTTAETSAIESTSATSGGVITEDGGANITVRGICWSTSHNPTLTNNITTDSIGIGTFSSSITGLIPGTLYYVRAYATNSVGTAYGNEVSFTTLAVLPTLTTTEASLIVSTTATSGGVITNDGGANITVRGICWSTSHNPTLSNSFTTDSTGIGTYSSSITGLNPGTLYYVRAYATNSVGTAYGNEVSFTTYAILPTLTTTEASSIASTTAISGGDITTDNGAAITARGVCWSTSHNPTLANSITTDSIGIGTFNSSITGLTPGVHYYVRAYATNSIGTAYGNEVSFTTLAVLPTIATSEASLITSTSATSGGVITNDGGATITARGVCWKIYYDPTQADSITADSTGTGTFSCSITGLFPGALYYIRAYATNSVGTAYGNEVSFTTLAVIPTLTTTEASSITSSTATCGGVISNGGGAFISAGGICWSTSHNPNLTNSFTVDSTVIETINSSITGLNPGTLYYVRAYATNSVGTAYGNEVSFTTLAVLPTLTTTEASSISSTSAISGGVILNDGGANITARGVCWSTSHDPSLSNSITMDSTGIGIYSSSITGLIPSAHYYARAYATNSVGTAYGNEISFTTLAVLPSLNTTEVSSITSTSAVSGGVITEDGGANITARGVCWSISHNPTLSNSFTTDSLGIGTYSSSITGLIPGALYYVRAYATNSIGTAYGNEISFTTPAVLPTLTTTEASSITSTTATSGGNITNDGGANITARGICWSTSHDPTLLNSITADSTSIGTFSSSITGLNPGTLYYVRAYATNSVGTFYGNEVSFTTLAILPSLNTTESSSITSTTVTSGGNITNDGGANITARGVCWSTSHNPTLSNSTTTDSIGIGTYSSFITGLIPGALYYVRAYATNSIGTTYGNEVSFTTLAILPTLTTTITSSITSTTATSGGNISNDGGATITARGVCWSTSASPTTADSKTTDGTGTGSFTSSLISLTPGTIYFIRSYASNSVGTAYGTESSFTTLAMPTLTTTDVTSITSTTASSGGDISSDGGAPVTARGICWSTSNNPTTANSKTTNGTGAGSFTSALSGLSPGITYYLRAYATNSVGTAYGNQNTFTTPAVLPTIYTNSITLLTSSTASCGGNVTNNGGASITARGVCWSTLHSPTLTDNHTSDSIGVGTFTSTLTGLVRGNKYYARAYATNSVGTAYGSEYNIFMPVMDIDNNVYDTTKIGTQTWLKQSLKVTHYSNGDAIPKITDNTAWSTLYSGAYCEYGAVATYGRLYNWYAVVDPRNLCPTGYHVPSNDEFTTLTTYLGGLTVLGGKLKESGTSHWQTPNTGGVNSSGFTALASGLRYSSGSFYGLQISCVFWSATEYDPGFLAYYISMVYSSAAASNGKNDEHLGASVRCLKDQ